MSKTSIVWFRNDLRLTDNPALIAAVKRGNPIVPVFIWNPDEEKTCAPGAASRWWLHRSLITLSADIQKHRTCLIIRKGNIKKVLQHLITQTDADVVFWNNRHEPSIIHCDDEIKHFLLNAGVKVETFNANLLFEPLKILNSSGNPFKVFTPFWKACLITNEPPPPFPQPKKLPVMEQLPDTLAIDDLHLAPIGNRTKGLSTLWKPGEQNALEKFLHFVENILNSYPVDRDRPDISGSSRLSAYLHFGEISPHQIWHLLKNYSTQEKKSHSIKSMEEYLRQLGWREFAHYLLFHFPHTVDKPFRSEFSTFPWAENSEGLKAWQTGQTGIPIIDAGMRELWTTGWMHNRVRMITASFLVKDLLIPWQQGAQWFWETLVDADLGNNTFGWQWTAGCGTDAAPFFRIFNPQLQGEKFDPQGNYIKKWIPELNYLSPDWIHKPWDAPSALLKKAGIKIGKTYPAPLINHKDARIRALEIVTRIKQAKKKK